MSIAKLRKIKGFTLIELMIVVAIIGILAAVAIPKFADLVTKSKEAAVKGALGSVRSAISIYYGDNEGAQPINTSLFTALSTSAKYMPAAAGGGFGDFTIPKNATAAGHASGKVITDADVSYTGGAVDGSATATPLDYSSTTGDILLNCTHADSKGSLWSSL